MDKREQKFADKFNNANLGFKYVTGYINSDSRMIIQCKECGQVLNRSGGFLRKAIRGERRISCDKCEGITRTNEFKEPIQKECNYCKKQFLTVSHSQSYCSDECYRKHRNQKREHRKRVRQVKLINNDSFDSTISLPKLIKKDKNICHICGCKCDIADYSVRDRVFYAGASFPSIDHVIPISKSGTHTWDNVKLAHHHCNIIKSNKEVY